MSASLRPKDLISTPADIAIALNGISHIATPDLARDLSPELIKMLTHSHANIRKRGVLALYKLMVRYPDIEQHAIDRMKDKLEDPEPSEGILAYPCQLVLM